MIVKKIAAAQDGRSPAILHARFAYIQTGAAAHGETIRVSPPLAAQPIHCIPAVMEAVARQSAKAKELSDHIAVALTPRDRERLSDPTSGRPSISTEVGLIGRLLRSQGYNPGTALYCWAWHMDEGHPHLHVLACRVNPITHTAASVRQPIRSLEREGLLIAHDYGLEYNNGRNSRGLRADLLGVDIDQVPLGNLRTPRDFVDPATDGRFTGTWRWRVQPIVHEAIKAATSWGEIHQRLAASGLSLSRLNKDIVEGRQTFGLTVREAEGTGAARLRGAKLSSLGHSYPRLTSRLGPYQPANQPQKLHARSRARGLQIGERAVQAKKQASAEHDRLMAQAADPRELAARLLYNEQRRSHEEKYRQKRREEREAARRHTVQQLRELREERRAWFSQLRADLPKGGGRDAVVSQVSRILTSMELAARAPLPGITPKEAFPPYRTVRQIYLSQLGDLHTYPGRWWPRTITSNNIAALSHHFDGEERAAIREGTSLTGLRLRQELVVKGLVPELDAKANSYFPIKRGTGLPSTARPIDPTPGICTAHWLRAVGQLSRQEKRQFIAGHGVVEFHARTAARFLVPLHACSPDDLATSLHEIDKAPNALKTPPMWRDACKVSLAQALATHPGLVGKPSGVAQVVLALHGRRGATERRRLASWTPDATTLGEFVRYSKNDMSRRTSVHLQALREVCKPTFPRGFHRPSFQALAAGLSTIEERLEAFERAGSSVRASATTIERQLPGTRATVEDSVTDAMIASARSQAEACSNAAVLHGQEFSKKAASSNHGIGDRQRLDAQFAVLAQKASSLAASLRSAPLLPLNAAKRIRCIVDETIAAVAWVPPVPGWSKVVPGRSAMAAALPVQSALRVYEHRQTTLRLGSSGGWSDDERRRFSRGDTEQDNQAQSVATVQPLQAATQKRSKASESGKRRGTSGPVPGVPLLRQPAGGPAGRPGGGRGR